jgi:hypothetical protein
VTDKIGDALKLMIGARTEWEETPALHFLYSDGPTVQPGRSAIPEESWAGVAPAQLLYAVSRVMRRTPGMFSAVASPHLAGVAFRTEAWFVFEDMADTGAASAAITAAEQGLVHAHPNRVEHRIVVAVTTDGRRYIATQTRGDEDTIEVIRLGPDDLAGGDVLDALTAMIASIRAGKN